ncbi:MAG: carbohydrate binding domain-containing protein [Planctomycetaceae bacterium]|jgi:hypothetical protein|nr:carbohydrate binding domain-containing protein [Planctomycetaceae bacterium]
MKIIVFLFGLLVFSVPSLAEEEFIPLGKEMLYGKFESQKWFTETDEETLCRKRESKGIFRFEVAKNGKESWHPLLISGTHTFEEGKVYTFSIRARASKPAEVYVGIYRDEKDYANLGFSSKLPLTREWKTFTFTFSPKETSRKARFDIGGFKEGVTYDFHKSTLKPGGNATSLPIH